MSLNGKIIIVMTAEVGTYTVQYNISHIRAKSQNYHVVK